ncbi:MAG: radical SAM family heme chaperone HemW [Pseudohongiellaceae bacterium]
MPTMLQTPPLSLYIHIPWCVRKCPYCDFNSHEAGDTFAEQEYVTALRDDLDADLDLFPQRELHTIFFGGGTPSLFSASGIADILTHVANHFRFHPQIEITLEANPGTADAQNFRGYREAGVNRLSLGIQSFADHHLAVLGRIHDSSQAHQAIETAIAAGFDNINLDLMHGLPNQSEAEAVADVTRALEYEPAHLSWYELTIEPNTVFYSKPPVLPDEPVLVAQQQQGQAALAAAGYGRYEVSAFSRSADVQSKHNLNYWRFGDYIGIGAGAHGKVTRADDNSLLRTRKHKQPLHYMENHASRRVACNAVDDNDRVMEFMLNALRLREGFDIPLFESRTGVAFSTVEKRVEYLQSLSLLERQRQRITATVQGYQHLNRVLEEFLPQ